jgi:alpha-galactosidase
MGRLTPENAKTQKKAYDECRRIAPLMLLGDYYPLTPYSLAKDTWIAWQFDRPEKGEGVVQAFRRAECPSTSIRVRLGGLDQNAVYTLTDFDVLANKETTGRELLEGGLPIVLKDRPAAAVISYKKKSEHCREPTL